jgi:hypothetical protein
MAGPQNVLMDANQKVKRIQEGFKLWLGSETS